MTERDWQAIWFVCNNEEQDTEEGTVWFNINPDGSITVELQVYEPDHESAEQSVVSIRKLTLRDGQMRKARDWFSKVVY